MAKLYVCELSRPYKFTSPVPGQKFVAWIMSNDPSLSANERFTVAKDLVSAGCRYAVCSGPDGTLWDDAVDFASLEVSPDLKDEEFVMTTWHDDQTLEEIAEYFCLNTAFDFFTPDNFVMVSVGYSNQLAESLQHVEKLLNVERAI